MHLDPESGIRVFPFNPLKSVPLPFGRRESLANRQERERLARWFQLSARARFSTSIEQ
jgi:hypothetical protein